MWAYVARPTQSTMWLDLHVQSLCKFETDDRIARAISSSVRCSQLCNRISEHGGLDRHSVHETAHLEIAGEIDAEPQQLLA